MLTHNFVTNPHLSTLLTQRLLCYRRQLESSVKNTYSHGDTGISSSNKKDPPSGGNFIPPDNHEPPVSFPGMPISVRQEEYFKSLRVNDLPVSHGIDASVPVHFVPSQQLIIEREPERFPSVQIQSSLSCSDLADVSSTSVFLCVLNYHHCSYSYESFSCHLSSSNKFN
ncbi:unnamed protein product [Schistosoma curassoni]|uniref:ZM domain-containing protein n=1 Tax=Schistosoma curassoni TaxID=6186 RepID=A0A183L0T7_9TREM|nr:unnamed protein product [Schistosoma curassoni]